MTEQNSTNEEEMSSAEINPVMQLMAEMMGNPDIAEKLIKKMFAPQLDDLHPEAKEALEKTRVQVVRQPDRIEIVIDSGGDPGVEGVKAMLLDSMLVPLSQIITFFGCRVDVIPQTGDQRD